MADRLQMESVKATLGERLRELVTAENADDVLEACAQFSLSAQLTEEAREAKLDAGCGAVAMLTSKQAALRRALEAERALEAASKVRSQKLVDLIAEVNALRSVERERSLARAAAAKKRTLEDEGGGSTADAKKGKTGAGTAGDGDG